MPKKSKPEKATSSSSNQFFPWFVLLVCLLGAAGQIWILWFSKRALGVPGQWVWPRISASFVSVASLTPALFAGFALVGYLAWTTREESGSPRSILWLGGLILVGFGWVVSVQSVTPLQVGLERGAFVMFYPRTSGYFHQAKYEAYNLPKFLADYEENISDQTKQENYLHIGTHPPGLTSLHRLLIFECNRNETLTDAVLGTAPKSVLSAIDFLSMGQARTGHPLSRGDTAALWLAVLISQLVAVLTVIPLYYLAARFGSVSSARMLAGIWVMVPALIIFLPKSDATFPCLALLLQWFWLKALEKNSLLLGVLTAILFVFAASLSLAFFTVGVILFLQVIYSYSKNRTGLHPTFGGLIAGVSCVGILYYFLQMNLFTIWIQNFQNHAVFYDHNVRTFNEWLKLNLFEGAFSVGAPIAICGLLGSALVLKQENREQIWIYSGLLIWAILWVSGKNMGEAARLWIFLMPYCLLAATPVLQKLNSLSGVWQRRIVSIGFLTLQAVVCLLTAIQIDGFGFTQLQL